jgi:hypothetical protein
VARPSKYTPERVERFLQAVKLGSTYRLAAAYAGISHETYATWLDTKPEFFAAVKEAEGAAVVGWLAKIEKAANEGNWQAAAWKLERRLPEDFGRKDRQSVELTGKDGGPVEVTSTGTLADRVAELAARYGSEGVLPEPLES